MVKMRISYWKQRLDQKQAAKTKIVCSILAF